MTNLFFHGLNKNDMYQLKQIAVIFLAVSICFYLWIQNSPSPNVTSLEPNIKSAGPNIILIMTDDQGWYDVGFNGNTKVKTPWMDSLASAGVIFDRFYSASAVCSPTRASLITGRNPYRTGVPHANTGHMRDKEFTIPEILKQVGYATGHFGKWHLGTFSKYSLDANRGGNKKYIADYSIPTSHGYNTFFCTESKVPTFDPMVYPKSFLPGESKRFGWRAVSQMDSTNAYGTSFWKEENLRETKDLRGDASQVVMNRVIPFMENAVENGQPFFTTIWFHTPHIPLVCDSLHRSYYEKSSLEEQLYYGAISAMDEQIGRLWKKLEELNMQEETIIFFCSDNGPERRTPGSSGIFRARKRSLYEGGVRVPAFVIWKNKLEGGKRTSFPSVTSDYLPTILDILKLKYPDDRPYDGISIWDAIKGDKKEREKPIGFICRKRVSWVTNQYKLIGNELGEDFELYDLLKDKSEKENIIEKYPVIAKQLKTELKSWMQSVDNSEKGMDY